MVKKRVWAVMLVLLPLTFLFGQTYSTGAILDPELYNSLPRKATQLSREYTALPRVVSLKQYAPVPGNQGQYGTCVTWASAYAARTISESIALGRVDRSLTTNNVFSPVFIYKSVAGDPSGKQGTVISWALNFMREQGAVKMPAFERSIDFLNILLSRYSNSQRYPIADYATLYDVPRGKGEENPAGILAVKKSLSEGKPVIFGMNCPDSFFAARDVWRPSDRPDRDYGGHAMCVVGYDDSKYGGAFEIQNSWGEQWGNGGYTWIPYDVFTRFVSEAYELIENLAQYKTATEYAGSVEIELYGSNAGMPVTFTQGYYRTTASYPSGTEFRYLMGNDKPAYVYAFAADEATTQTTRIFPSENENISPVLDYAENAVAFPGEYSWIQLDDRPGTDYLVVLYAKQSLDIDAIRARFSRERGAFAERVARAVGPDYIPYASARYEANRMRFTAQSFNSKAVFGLLLAIEHRSVMP
jgi:hypothetical protein